MEKQVVFLNVNIGIDINDKETIKNIEKELDSKGIYYNHEGSDKHIYNINAGFNNPTEGYIYEIRLNNVYDVYVETESFTEL